MEPRLPSADQTTDSAMNASGWRRAVRESARPVLLMDLPSTRIVDFSEPAAAALDTVDLTGCRLHDLIVHADVGAQWRPAELLASGELETVHGRVQFARTDGSLVNAWCWTRAIRSPDGTDFALMGIQPSDDDVVPVVANSPAVHILPSSTDLGLPMMTLRLDRHWHVVETTQHRSTETDHAGLPPETFILDCVIGDQRTDLLCSLALATTGARVIVQVWMTPVVELTSEPVSIVVTIDRDGEPGAFVLELFRLAELGSYVGAAEALDLELRLRRISSELSDIFGANSLDHLDGSETPTEVSQLVGLSERQFEVVTHLLSGRRVPDIAQQMFVSQSTVRNHLASVYQKFGVHSQSELIAIVRGEFR